MLIEATVVIHCRSYGRGSVTKSTAKRPRLGKFKYLVFGALVLCLTPFYIYCDIDGYKLTLRRMEKEKTNKEIQDEQAYIGNIWGWKFSFISLGVIIVFIILYMLSD